MKTKATMKKVTYWLATFASSALCAVLFICANTNSCGMIHQPDTPAGLEQFSRLK